MDQPEELLREVDENENATDPVTEFSNDGEVFEGVAGSASATVPTAENT